MPKNQKVLIYFVLIFLAFASIYFIWLLPQYYGHASLVVIALTIIFNFKKGTLSTYLVSILCSSLILFKAYTFSEHKESQRGKFDIETAVKFETSDFNTALTKAKKEKKSLFIDFYAVWCGPCLVFTRNILTDQHVGQQMNDTFINLKYDAEKGVGKEIARKYGIKWYPTLLIIDSDGKELENLTGERYPTREDLLKAASKYKK